MQDGQILTADKIISGAGVLTTYQKLLPPEVVQRHQLEDQLKKISPLFHMAACTLA
jgi:all-trans-retinol 13,14-reductase